MSSTNGKTQEADKLTYHDKLDAILEALVEQNDLLSDILEKLNNFAIEQEAYGLNYLGREDN